MNWMTSLAIFFVIWWVVLFTVLPINIKSQWEERDPDDGTEPGAPVNANLKKKFILTTIISVIVFIAFRLALAAGLFSSMTSP